MYEQSRARRHPARYLAPLALATAAVATYVIVQHDLGVSSSTRTTRSTATVHGRSSSTSSGTKAGAGTVAGGQYYTVRAGDSLSVISARTGVSLPLLERLNPGVSSSALQIGQRLRLRR